MKSLTARPAAPNRAYEFGFLLTIGAVLCLSLVFFVPTEEAKALLSCIGLGGLIVYLGTGSNISMHARGRAIRGFHVALGLIGLAVLCFMICAIPVAFSPKVGDPDFVLDSPLMVTFEWLMFSVSTSLALLACLIAWEAIRGWAIHLNHRLPGPSQTSTRNRACAGLLSALLFILLVVPLAVAAPRYVLTGQTLLFSVALVVGVASASAFNSRKMHRHSGDFDSPHQ